MLKRAFIALQVQSSIGDDKERAEGAATFHSLSQSLFSASPAGSGKLHSKGQDSAQTHQAQTHQARESAQILSEVKHQAPYLAQPCHPLSVVM